MHTTKFHLLHHFVEGIRIFGYISVIDAFGSEQFNVQFEKGYQGWCRRLGRNLQKTGMLLNRQKQSAWSGMSTKGGTSFQDLICIRVSSCMEKRAGSVQQIRAACLNKTVRYIAGR